MKEGRKDGKGQKNKRKRNENEKGKRKVYLKYNLTDYLTIPLDYAKHRCNSAMICKVAHC